MSESNPYERLARYYPDGSLSKINSKAAFAHVLHMYQQSMHGQELAPEQIEEVIMANVKQFLVLGADKSVDIKATLDSFARQLESYVARKRRGFAVFVPAINEIYEDYIAKYPGTSPNQQWLVNQVAIKHNVQPDQYAAEVSLIKQAIGSIFKSSRGRGGMVRWVDVPGETPPAPVSSGEIEDSEDEDEDEAPAPKLSIKQKMKTGQK